MGCPGTIPKPPAPDRPEYVAASDKLIRLVKTLSAVPVLHQKRRKTITVHPPLFDTQASFDSSPGSRPPSGYDLLLIGASTGGPPVVSGIVERLSRPCPVPIIVVQHITKGFAAGFAEWLAHAARRPTKLVNSSAMLEAGTVYIASDDADLVFTSARTVRSKQEPDTRGPNPNIDRLFLSAAQYVSTRTIALLLTGMGADGAAGLAALQRAGATAAVQDPETCAVDSMPRSAIKMGVRKSLTPDQIVGFLNRRLK